MAISDKVIGRFKTINDERYYAIENVDRMPPFLINMVSDSDHWMFIASNGGLSAGRVSPETSLFPYVTVDRIYESTLHTGSRTLMRVERDGERYLWEPFNQQLGAPFSVTRNIYKGTLGNQLLFEEINHELELVFTYSWTTSLEYGFVRSCTLCNRVPGSCRVELLDGLQNILPAGTPRHTQANASYLVDAYKWSELESDSGLALFSLYSAITDRAEPCESLRATTVFCLGLESPRVLLSSRQLETFREGGAIETEHLLRGHRGAYMVNAGVELVSGFPITWRLVADLEQSQADAVGLQHALQTPERVSEAVQHSVSKGSDRLARILSAADALQHTGEETVSTHHCANVLFNTMRGGIFDDQYLIHGEHFNRHVKHFNCAVYRRHGVFLDGLPATLQRRELLNRVTEQGDPQLERLCHEYLPLTFGRRHGDPSRPWNEFAIKLFDDAGNRLLCYQGNWRDIFQNWEALLMSYPEYIEQVIAKFVNASTADGYNPYRISEAGIDWEVEEPDDPWSYIGYWGDHQIIYLLKLLELSLRFHPEMIRCLLPRPVFSYANVPYRIKPFAALLNDAKDTVVYDHDLADLIDKQVARLGADGKLLLDRDGDVLQVNLVEKLLVPLLAKLANLVIDGGIWLNTQRPEWNDANNALVGQGLSMVTLYYMRRYVEFLRQLLGPESYTADTADLSAEVSRWLRETADILSRAAELPAGKSLSGSDRFFYLRQLGEAAGNYRTEFYRAGSLSGPVAHALDDIRSMLDSALTVINRSIRSNLRQDGLYHAYNLLVVGDEALDVEHLYPMLEGQVAALSSGAIDAGEAAELLESLFTGELYRADQNSFLLYPDRDLPRFLDKAVIPEERIDDLPILASMLERGDRRMIERDLDGRARFNPALINIRALRTVMEEVQAQYPVELPACARALEALYEEVFRHRAFTGRSGGMFAFEGLGSIYWHMVSKLLLAAQELFFAAREQGVDASTVRRLGRSYYRIREGIGFNKTPLEYGAFPVDPYSHTPAHMGAQQPGMTGQVKEEILTRFAELGLRIQAGAVNFDPGLLRAREFTANPGVYCYLDVRGDWREIAIPEQSLAFSWCQVPIVYRLEESGSPGVVIHREGGESHRLPELLLPSDVTEEISIRSGRIERIELVIQGGHLFPE